MMKLVQYFSHLHQNSFNMKPHTSLSWKMSAERIHNSMHIYEFVKIVLIKGTIQITQTEISTNECNYTLHNNSSKSKLTALATTKRFTDIA